MKLTDDSNGYEDCIISEDNGKLYYNRYFHPSQKHLCQILENRYGNNTSCAIYPSGMCAIDSIFQIFMIENKWNNATVVYGNELYCDTPRTIKYLNSSYIPLKLLKVKSQDDNEIIETFKNKVNRNSLTILFIEGCSNPNGNIFNFELLSQIRDMFNNKTNLKVIVDNTWVTSTIFNPLK